MYQAENQGAQDKNWREVLEREEEEEEGEERSDALGLINPLPLGAEFVRDLSSKALDLSVFVRKSALQVLLLYLCKTSFLFASWRQYIGTGSNYTLEDMPDLNPARRTPPSGALPVFIDFFLAQSVP